MKMSNSKIYKQKFNKIVMHGCQIGIQIVNHKIHDQ